MSNNNKPEDTTSIKEVVRDIYREVLVHSKEMGEVKTDLREHMRRTAVAESKISGIERQVFMVHGALGLLSIVATIAAIVRYLL